MSSTLLPSLVFLVAMTETVTQMRHDAKSYVLYALDCLDGIPRYYLSRSEATQRLREKAKRGLPVDLYKVITRPLSGAGALLMVLNGRGWIQQKTWITGYRAKTKKASEEDSPERRLDQEGGLQGTSQSARDEGRTSSCAGKSRWGLRTVQGKPGD